MDFSLLFAIFPLRTFAYRNGQWQFHDKDFSDCCIFGIPAVQNRTVGIVPLVRTDFPDLEAGRNKHLPLGWNGARLLSENQDIYVL